MPEADHVPFESPREPDPWPDARPSASGRNSRSIHELWGVLARRRRLVGSVVGGLLLACLLYCLIAPNQYEASARVELRATPISALSLGAPETFGAVSILSAPAQQETLANVFRSDQLAWKVIIGLKLYQAPGFMGRFAGKFPDFHAEAPAAGAWLARWWWDCCWRACFIALSPLINTRPAPRSKFVPRLHPRSVWRRLSR